MHISLLIYEKIAHSEGYYMHISQVYPYKTGCFYTAS